jgi:hypothetical protein
MLYAGYDWDLSPGGIILDDEINLDKLNWNNGDYFKLVVTDTGRKYLKKIDVIEEYK